MHVIRVADVRATIRRLPAKTGSVAYGVRYSRLCGTPRRWRRLKRNAVLRGEDAAAYRKLYLAVSDWCRAQYHAYRNRSERGSTVERRLQGKTKGR